MASEDVIHQIHGLFESAILSVFAALGCPIRRILEPPRELKGVPLASMDAGSRDLEIMLFIGLPLTVLALSYPVKSEDIFAVDESHLEDWILEIANQVMGRLKNALLRAGSDLQMTLPSFYAEQRLSEVLPPGYDHAIFYFELDGEVFECCLSISVIHPDLVLNLNAAGEDGASHEGELELF